MAAGPSRDWLVSQKGDGLYNDSLFSYAYSFTYSTHFRNRTS